MEELPTKDRQRQVVTGRPDRHTDELAVDLAMDNCRVGGWYDGVMLRYHGARVQRRKNGSDREGKGEKK